MVIDARKLDDFGIGTYVRELVRNAATLRPGWTFVLIARPGAAASSSGRALEAANVEWVESRAGAYGPTELLTIAREAGRARADVFHAPHYVYPLRLECPGVVTIHDCIHLRFPEQLPRPLGVLPRALSRSYAERMMRHATRAASAVLTVSETTKRDLVALVGATPDKVRVIANGCDEYFLESPPAAEIDAAVSTLGLPKRYVLYAGNAKPHKNLGRLLSAFDRLRARSADLHMLVVGGADARLGRQIAGRRGVRFLGRVSRQHLRALYHRAAVFAFPSLYEGFGLPPLEAMACGTPTIVSNRGALPEVTEDGAVQVEPTSVSAIERGIRELLDDAARAAELGERGRQRAATFSWSRAAETTLGVYEAVAGSSSAAESSSAGESTPATTDGEAE